MARKPSQRAHAAKEEVPELNLVPIMAILVILIPVLLFAFTFFEVRVQAVAAPRLGPSAKNKKDNDDEKKPLNLTVLITKDGFAVKQQAELEEPELPIPKRTFEGQDEPEYDYATLYNRIRAKKDAYPDETTINVGAEFQIPWYVIARTLDATRVKLTKATYEDLKTYSAAEPLIGKDTDGDGSKDPVEMFPAVTFVVAE